MKGARVVRLAKSTTAALLPLLAVVAEKAVAKAEELLRPKAALVLGAQILFGALFGIMGLFLADPIVAMIKVYLEERSRALAAKRDATE